MQSLSDEELQQFVQLRREWETHRDLGWHSVRTGPLSEALREALKCAGAALDLTVSFPQLPDITATADEPKPDIQTVLAIRNKKTP